MSSVEREVVLDKFTKLYAAIQSSPEFKVIRRTEANYSFAKEVNKSKEKVAESFVERS